MSSIIKYLSIFTLLITSIALFVLSYSNPHPKHLKSDQDYARSKHYNIEYDMEDTEETPVIPKKSTVKQKISSNPTVPLGVKMDNSQDIK